MKRQGSDPIHLAVALVTLTLASAGAKADSGQHVACGKQFVTFVAYQMGAKGVPNTNKIQTFTVPRGEIRTVRFSAESLPWVEVRQDVHYIPFAAARDLTRCLHGTMDDAYRALEKELASYRVKLKLALDEQLRLGKRLDLERSAHRALVRLQKLTADKRRCD